MLRCAASLKTKLGHRRTLILTLSILAQLFLKFLEIRHVTGECFRVRRYQVCLSGGTINRPARRVSAAKPLKSARCQHGHIIHTQRPVTTFTIKLLTGQFNNTMTINKRI